LIQTIDQSIDSIKPQPFTLVMEIKVDVVQSIVLQSVQSTFVRFLDGFLVPFLIDQVDEDLGTVQRDLLIEMSVE